MNNKIRTFIAALISLVGISLVVLVALGQDGQPQDNEPNLEVDTQDTSFLSTGFTYQGYLTDNGSPANGQYDFRFRLFNAAAVGTQYGTTDEDLDVSVEDGVFIVTISPGSGVFETGGTRWLAIEVRPAGIGNYTLLHPRQEIRPVPQAIYAEYAENLVEPGDTIIQVSPFDAIESDGQSNLSFAARGTGRLEIERNVSGNDFFYIPVDVPAQIFGSRQQLALESMRFCYNGASQEGLGVIAGIVRATVRQTSDFDTVNMLGEMYTPPLGSNDDECVTVTADNPQIVTGSVWVRFEIIASDILPLEIGEIYLRFSSDN